MDMRRIRTLRILAAGAALTSLARETSSQSQRWKASWASAERSSIFFSPQCDHVITDRESAIRIPFSKRVPNRAGTGEDGEHGAAGCGLQQVAGTEDRIVEMR